MDSVKGPTLTNQTVYIMQTFRWDEDGEEVPVEKEDWIEARIPVPAPA